MWHLTKGKSQSRHEILLLFRPLSVLRHDMGMGNTMCIWKQVCSGTGTGSRLLYLGNTVPFSTVLQVCAGMPVLAFWSGE
jgi:hypothetical protein